jgi:predicted nucleic acid-binding protein
VTVLVDTSVWIDHLRRDNRRLVQRLEQGEVCCHPFVIGELACGFLRRRSEILTLLAALPQAPLAGHAEVLALVETARLFGKGLGWIDVHLLAAARLGASRLWTADRVLADTAAALDLGA